MNANIPKPNDIGDKLSNEFTKLLAVDE